MLTPPQEHTVTALRRHLTRAYGGIRTQDPTPAWMTHLDEVLDLVEQQAEQITALRAGQGAGTHHRDLSGAVPVPLHEAHPIPDSTKGQP